MHSLVAEALEYSIEVCGMRIRKKTEYVLKLTEDDAEILLEVIGLVIRNRADLNVDERFWGAASVMHGKIYEEMKKSA